MELVQISPLRQDSRAQAGVAQGPRARGRKLPRPQAAGPLARPAHRVRKRPLPQHRRVLAPQDRDLHDAGQPVHAPLRILRRAQGPARAHRFRRAAPRGRGRGHARTATCRHYQRQPRRRPARRRARLRHGHRRDSPPGSRLPRRSAHPRLSGQRGSHSHRRRCAA